MQNPNLLTEEDKKFLAFCVVSLIGTVETASINAAKTVRGSSSFVSPPKNSELELAVNGFLNKFKELNNGKE